MKKTLTELFDGCGPEELDRLLPDELDTPLPEDAMERIKGMALEKTFPKAAKKRRFRGRPWLRVAVAACLVLAVGLGSVAYAAEAREYGAAVRFFDENGLSTDGLSREDVKAVYWDITTQRFTYDKTAEVIERSVAGVEIFQKEPTPEELAELWNHGLWNFDSPREGVSYRRDYQYKPHETLGFDVLDKSILECYQDDALLWTAEFSEFRLEDSVCTSAGTAVWGIGDTWSSEQPTYAWLARVDEGGDVLWERQLDHGFRHEYVAQVLDNGDGTWAVISRGDLKYLCLSQYDTGGNELSFRKTEVGNAGILNAARLEDGYLVQLWVVDGETARLVKLDREADPVDNFTYKGKDCDYYIEDMVEFAGRVYLSAYVVPRQTDEGGRHEIADILHDLFDRGVFQISSEELTPMVRDNYTAVLLVCDSEGGVPRTFYSVKGSLGAELTVNEAGELEWNVNSVVNTEFSPYTNAYSIRGTCQVYRYSFDETGALVRQVDTGETSAYYR